MKNKTATEAVKDTLKTVDKAVSEKIVDGIELGGMFSFLFLSLCVAFTWTDPATFHLTFEAQGCNESLACGINCSPVSPPLHCLQPNPTPPPGNYQIMDTNLQTDILTEKAAAKTKEVTGIASSEASSKASEMTGQAQGKAAELSGEAKGKAHEMAGKAKGTKEEIKGKM